MNTTATESTPRESVEAIMQAQQLAVKAVFVPWSRSRNAKEKSPSLNWTVTLTKAGRDVLSTDYSAGCGHCPAYKNKGKMTPWEQQQAIKSECETGKAGRFMVSLGHISRGAAILPDSTDVLYSLIMDAEVLDAGGFEDWAANYGYDADSRSAEKTYRACLEIALKLRVGLGDALLVSLREAFQDY